jgi:hypothetical protein
LRPLAYILGEIVIAALIVVTLSVALFYQVTWVFFVAPLIALAGFVAVIAYAKRNARLAWVAALLCPTAYTACLLTAGLESGVITDPDLVAVGLYLALGVALFLAHFALNRYVR